MRRSHRQPCDPHFLDQLAGPAVVQGATEQLVGLGNPRAKLVGNGLGIVAVPRQLRLEVGDAGGQHAIDDAEVDRLHASGKPRVERSDEIARADRRL